MSKAKEHFYEKLKTKLLETNYFSSSLTEKARSLKQQNEKSYVKHMFHSFYLQQYKRQVVSFAPILTGLLCHHAPR